MQISEREISRREFLDRTVKTAAVLVVAPLAVTVLEGCGPTGASSEVYHGPIEILDGRPVITKEQFEKLTSALANSGEPLLEKVARDVTTLKTSETNPADLPPIVNEDATPLVITRDFDIYSWAAYSADIDMENPGFIFDKDSGTQEWHFAKPASIAIHIGSSEELEKADPLQEAILLAKEEIGLMVGLQTVEAYQEVSPEGIVKNPDGSVMTDPASLEKANFIIGFAKYSRDGNGPFWALIDITPMMLLAPTIYDLIVAGKLSDGSADLSAFYKAVNYVFSDPQLMDKVIELQKKWAQSKSIYGPEGFGVELYDPKIVEAVNALFPQIYPDGV